MCHASKVFIWYTVIQTFRNKAELLVPNRKMLKPQNIKLNFTSTVKLKLLSQHWTKKEMNSFSKETLQI